MMSFRTKRGICTVVLLATHASTAICQELPFRIGAVAGPRRSDALFGQTDLWLAAAFAAGTVALFAEDKHIIASVRDSARLHSPGFDRTARVFGFFASPGTFIAIGTLYATGQIAGEARLKQVALHGAEGMLAGLVAAGLLKGTLGRSRPFVTADTNPRDFGLFRGFRADRFQAFPSGHTTTAFAFAAAVTSDIHGWDATTAWIVGPILYGGAAFTGLSRMYEDKHWASDIVMGAALGTFAGLKVVRYSRTEAGRRFDRRILGDDAGMRVGYTLRW
jgi:membrane-associated phospholipid phosphatase